MVEFTLLKHLYKLCDIAKEKGLNKVFVHAITDGRDTDPKSGKTYIQKLENHLETSTGSIASIIGRYYTMDRDQRWDRIKIAYDLYLSAKGSICENFIDSIEEPYSNDVTDEFLKPMVNPNVDGRIEEDDVVICFNFRTDRLRQLTTVLTQKICLNIK